MVNLILFKTALTKNKIQHLDGTLKRHRADLHKTKDSVFRFKKRVMGLITTLV